MAGSFFFCQQVPRPFVVPDGIPCGEHFHRLIPRRNRIPEGRLSKTARQRMSRQLRSRSTALLEHLKGSAVQQPPPRMPGLSVGYLPYLLVGERVGGSGV